MILVLHARLPTLWVVIVRHVEHMAQLMSDGEGGTNSIFLTDGAAPVLVAHGPQLCKP